MTDNRNRIEFSTLPTWAERFIDDLDDRFGVLSGEMAAKNFPDGEAPPWLRAKSLDGSPSAPRWIDSFFARADRSLQQLWIEKGFLSTDPEWLADLTRRDEADVARVFLLTGNVNDYAFSPAYGYKPVIDRLEESAKHRKEWVIRYSLSNGFSRPTRGDSTPEDADSPFEELGIEDIDRRNSSSSPREALNEDFRIMESLLTGGYDGSICLIVDNIHMLVPSDSSTLNRHVLTDAVQRWAQSPAMFQSDNQVILMADSTEALNRELRSGSSHIDTIELPWPDESDSRLKFLLSLFSGGRVRPMTGIRREATNVPRFGGRFGDRTSQRLQQLADRTSGLNLVGVENVVLQVDPPDPEPITLEFLKELKRDILSDESGGLLEVTEPDAGIDRSEAFNHVGGLDPVCTKLLEISRMMDEASNSETVRRSLPNGLLFLGPPGTGKTLVARAFANACGVNFAEFGNIRSMWVGESERNLSRALELIRSLKPVVVFLDEIDQSMGQRGSASDSGVDQRLFARILQFMSDPELEGEVIWIGASNEPAKIDAALKRSGRFDLRIPFLRPPEEARKDILRLQFQQRGASIDFDADQWKQVLTATDGYTGAELESIAKEAIWNHLVADGDTQNVVIPFAAMESALESFQPPVDRSEYHRMEQAALREVTAVDMLPDEYRKQRMELIEGSDE